MQLRSETKVNNYLPRTGCIEIKQDPLEKPGIKKSSFSCITKFGIKMTAEDCNLEILRLSYTIPSTSTTSETFHQDQPLIDTTTLMYGEDLKKGIVLATPVDLSVSTPLRFEVEKQQITSSEFQNDEVEEKWENEPASLQKAFHVVKNYLKVNKENNDHMDATSTLAYKEENMSNNETSSIAR